jgi:sialate O-acetylesterase
VFSMAAVALASGVSLAHADVVPHPLFVDNAVLQQGVSVPIWGTADPNEKVTVEFAGQTVAATADPRGKWLVRLAPLKVGEPRTLKISGRNKIELKNVLVGEVWVCSGQSNMERQLGLRAGQPPILNWKKEVAAADFPHIRHFGVAQTKSFTPLSNVQGNWEVCSPETVSNFTAVGYFFGRDLHRARQVPIGLIHSSWGGTPAEAWTSESTLNAMPDFAEPLAQIKSYIADPALNQRRIREKQNAWFAKVDPGSQANWSRADLEVSDWKTMTLPNAWEAEGYPGFDGVFWFRRNFDLPANWNGGDVELHLGAIDDDETTWVNGIEAGATIGWNVPRVYRIPASVLKPSGNVIAVRVLDSAAGGGIWGGDDAMRVVVNPAGETNIVSLAGQWFCKPGVSLRVSGWPPTDFAQSASAPSVLYNGMIAPLLPYAIRGVIWYQGESNVGRERQYRKLFPAMIEDWRRAWGQGSFPFLFVQIAPYNSMTPEIREAQLLAWKDTPDTAMVVTLDCGDANDIHPANKEPVGVRLALAARAIAYQEKVDYSGPILKNWIFKSGTAVLHFNHSAGGLAATGGALGGFTIAGADKVFHPAKAEIQGETVVVHAPEVSEPVAVRYAWANVPEGNLFNRAGLPASPFRTDTD